MTRADLIFVSTAVTLLVLFPESGPGVVLFRGVLAAHVGLYLLTRRWQPSTAGQPLLQGIRVPDTDPWWTRALLLSLLVGAIALRLPSLGEGLWFDEIQTLLAYARKPIATIATSFESRNQHMLYSFLARGSFVVLGESGWALRLPAVVFGVASLWALYRLARLLTRRDEALFAVALLAVSYHHIWFSQNARGYTGLLLFAVLGSEIFVRLIGGIEARVQAAWAYGAVMALGIFTHATAVFMVVTHALIWAGCWWRVRRSASAAAAALPLLGMMLAATLSLMLYAQVLPQLRRTITPSRSIITATDVAAIRAERSSAVKEPPTYISDRATGTDRIARRLEWFINETSTRLAAGLPGSWPTLMLGTLAALAGLWAYARQGIGSFAVLVLPGATTLIILFSLDQILFPRFFFFALGFLVLVLVRGVYTVPTWFAPRRGRVVASAALAAVVGANLLTVPRAWAPKEDYAGARDYVLHNAGPDDVIVVTAMAKMPFLEYFGEAWKGTDTDTGLRKLAAAHGKTWVIYTHTDQMKAYHAALLHELQQNYTQVAVFPATVGNGDIFVAMSHQGDDAVASPKADGG